MKIITKVLTYIFISVTIISCKKDVHKVAVPSGALTVVNMVNGGGNILFNNSKQLLSPNASGLYFLTAGQDRVKFADTSVHPAKVYFDQSITVQNAGNYSLFLAGSSPSAVDQILIKETYRNYSDSLCGVRFINLAPASNPVSVNILGQPKGTELNNLAYKAYSEFKQYPAKKANSTYTFEIREAATGTLLTTYQLPTPYFRNATIMLYGSSASSILLLKNP